VAWPRARRCDAWWRSRPFDPDDYLFGVGGSGGNGLFVGGDTGGIGQS
jgi:hypothetical protein